MDVVGGIESVWDEKKPDTQNQNGQLAYFSSQGASINDVTSFFGTAIEKLSKMAYMYKKDHDGRRGIYWYIVRI